MIFNRQNQNLERLSNVLISDKQFSPKQVEKVLKADVYSMLSNYCTLSPNDVSVEVAVQKDGSYKFVITASSSRLKIFGSLPDVY